MFEDEEIFCKIKNTNFGLWCNGNTTVFGAVVLGSNPGSPTKNEA